MLIVFIRVLIVYLLIVLSLRLMGKRQIGQLQPSELVVTILVSNIATMAIEDSNVPLLGGIIPVFSIVAFDVIVSAISLKSKRAREIISGMPRIIIHDGQLDQHEMRELRFTLDDIMSQLRAHNIFDIKDVSFAVVETTGVLNVLPKYAAQPLTPKMLDLSTPPGGDAPPVVMISDGVVIQSAFAFCNLRPEWLDKVLEQEQLTSSQVFLMTCDRQAQYLLVRRKSKEELKNQQKEITQL